MHDYCLPHDQHSRIVVWTDETLLMRRRSSLPWRVPTRCREESIRRGADVPG